MQLPDQTFVENILTPEFHNFLEALSQDGNIHKDIRQGAELMCAFLDEQAGRTTSELADVLGKDRTRLYRGVTPDYGPQPPYEAVWNERAESPVEFLAALARLYHANGVTLEENAYERADYLGVELAFLEVVAAQEMEKLIAGEIDAADQIAAAQKRFLEDHLQVWTSSFISSALDYASTDFFRGHLLMLRGFLADQQALFE